MPVQVPANRPVFDCEVGDGTFAAGAIGTLPGVVVGTLVGVGVGCGTSEIGAGNRCAEIKSVVVTATSRINFMRFDSD